MFGGAVIYLSATLHAYKTHDTMHRISLQKRHATLIVRAGAQHKDVRKPLDAFVGRFLFAFDMCCLPFAVACVADQFVCFLNGSCSMP